MASEVLEIADRHGFPTPQLAVRAADELCEA
jgi:hypothetical protein